MNEEKDNDQNDLSTEEQQPSDETKIEYREISKQELKQILNSEVAKRYTNIQVRDDGRYFVYGEYTVVVAAAASMSVEPCEDKI